MYPSMFIRETEYWSIGKGGLSIFHLQVTFPNWKAAAVGELEKWNDL